MWNEPILRPTQTKRQHFVPRLYLRQFTGTDRKMHVVDLEERRQYMTSLENVAVQTRFYDVRMEGNDFSAEDWLSALENGASSVLRLLLDDPSAIQALDDERTNTLARFIASLIMRTPSKRQETDDSLDEAFSAIEQKLKGQFLYQFGRDEGLKRYREWREEQEPAQPAASTASLLSEIQGFANLLKAAPWRIGSARKSACLFASDNPVSRYLPPDTARWAVGAFSSYAYYLPLSPEILLKIERRPDPRESSEALQMEGPRRVSVFSEKELAFVRYVTSHQAFRYLYGDNAPRQRISAKDAKPSFRDVHSSRDH